MLKLSVKFSNSVLNVFLNNRVDNNITKKTFVLITKSLDDISSKTNKAKELGIPIMVPEEFIKKYL